MCENKICDGSGDNGNHCCYVDGEVCRFLTYVENVPRCSLRLELGSWDKVHKDMRYLTHIQPVWDRVGIESCGSFGRDTKQCCFKDK